MRRIALFLVVAATAVLFTGCTGWNWSDPFHPSVMTPASYAKYTR